MNNISPGAKRWLLILLGRSYEHYTKLLRRGKRELRTGGQEAQVRCKMLEIKLQWIREWTAALSEGGSPDATLEAPADDLEAALPE